MHGACHSSRTAAFRFWRTVPVDYLTGVNGLARPSNSVGISLVSAHQQRGELYEQWCS
jgi:hypothetical protein